MSKRQRISVSKRIRTQEITSLDFKLALIKATEPNSTWTINYLVSEVMSLQITPDEKFVLAGQMNGTLSILQIGTDTENQIEAHKAEIKCLAIASDSSFLLTGSYDTTIKMWTIPDLRQISELSAHTSHIYSIAMATDNKSAVSAGGDHKVYIWDLTDKKLIQSIEGINITAYSIFLSRDDNILALGCTDNTIKLWNFKESREQMVIHGHEMPVYSVVISQDMNFIVSASIDKTVRKWNLRTGKQERILAECSESVRCVALTIDDKYVIYGQYNGRIGIIPLLGKFEEIMIQGHSGAINCLQVSGSCKYICSGSNDLTLRINRLSDFPLEILLSGHKREINNIEISHDSKMIASASHDHTILIWNFDDSSPIASLEGHTAEVYCVTFTKDLRCISGGVDEAIFVWDLSTYSEVATMKGHEESIRSLAVTPDDKKLVSGSMDKTIRVWNLKDYQEIYICKGHESMINCVAVQNSKFAISGSNDATIRIWSIKSGKFEHLFKEHKAEISCMAVTDNRKKLIAGGRDGCISIWNLKYRCFEGFLVDVDSKINKLCLSGDSQFIFTQHDNKIVKIWSLPDKQILGMLYEHKKILSLAVSNDNEWIVLSTQNKLRLHRSPLSLKVPYSIVPYKYSFLAKSMVHRLLNGNYKSILEDCLHCIYLPWNVNLLHVISHMNYPKLLKYAISLGVKFLGSEAGETPLKVSLNRRSKLCAEILLKRIPRELYSKNNSIFEYVGEILESLNRSSLRSLHILYDAAFPHIASQNLPRFGKLLKAPPIIILSDDPTINIESFLRGASNDEDLADREIEFRQSLLKLDLDPGSSESIKFMKTLKLCKNPEVFRSELVKVILTYKWRQIMPLLMIQVCVYLVLVVALIVQTVVRDYPITLIIILFINSLFLLYEIFQLKKRLRSYFLNISNILGICRIFFLFAYPIVTLAKSSSEFTEDCLLAIANAVTWLRLIGYLRIFDQTRYMIRMCTEVIKALGPFIVIFITIITAIILAYYSDSQSVYTFKELVVNIYSLSYGQFEIEKDTEMQKFVFVVATLTITLVMLNLIIALMSDVFVRVKSAIVIADRKEMASIILEVDSILWMRKYTKKTTRRYIQQCSVAESRTLTSVIQRETSQIINTISAIEQRGRSNESKLEEILSSFAKVETLEKDKDSDRIQEMLMSIKHDIKDAKKEMRLEMMKAKLDIADIRKEVLKGKLTK